jgi:hypothetical protein
MDLSLTYLLMDIILLTLFKESLIVFQWINCNNCKLINSKEWKVTLKTYTEEWFEVYKRTIRTNEILLEKNGMIWSPMATRYATKLNNNLTCFLRWFILAPPLPIIAPASCICKLYSYWSVFIISNKIRIFFSLYISVNKNLLYLRPKI